MIFLESCELPLLTGFKVAVPDVSGAAGRVQIVEALAVRPPNGTSAIRLLNHHRLESLRADPPHPYLPGGRTGRIAPFTVELVAPASEKDARSVGRHGRIAGLHVEKNLLRHALVGRYQRYALARLGAGLVAVDLAKQRLAVRTPRAGNRRFRMERHLPHGVGGDVELEYLHAAIPVASEGDFQAVRSDDRPGIGEHRGTKPPGVAAFRLGQPQMVVPFKHELRSVSVDARVRAKVYARPIVFDAAISHRDGSGRQTRQQYLFVRHSEW